MTFSRFFAGVKVWLCQSQRFLAWFPRFQDGILISLPIFYRIKNEIAGSWKWYYALNNSLKFIAHALIIFLVPS